MNESNRKRRSTIYIAEPVFSEFKGICKREGEKISWKLEQYMIRYNAAHSEGNPQLRLEKFTGISTSKTCFFCQGRFPMLKKVKFISGLVAAVCDNCCEEKSTPPYRTVVKVLGVIT